MKKLIIVVFLACLFSCVKKDCYTYQHEYDLKIIYRNGDSEELKFNFESYYKECGFEIRHSENTTYLTNCYWEKMNVVDLRRFEVLKHKVIAVKKNAEEDEYTN
jgi:hypothetical protein